MERIISMIKKRKLLLTFLAIIGIIIIVCGVWIAKHSVEIKDELTKTSVLGEKAVLAFSSNVEDKSDVQLPGIEKQIDQTQKLINDFAAANIEYNFISSKEEVNSELIKSWLIVGENSVVLDEQKVSDYVTALAQKYNTVGVERKFIDSHGKEVTVSGGPYGWEIDCEKETKALIDIINNHESTRDREPEYKQRALTRGVNDIGNTYVEVNMSEQKMWYYKEGELLVSTSIVTGNTTRGNGTPTMVGYIHNKARNINLVGQGYVAFVHYWMKVNGSIGIHDASWRSKFGGSIYTTNGSHGCINTPYDEVKTIFENIDIGTPVIVFYEQNGS